MHLKQLLITVIMLMFAVDSSVARNINFRDTIMVSCLVNDDFTGGIVGKATVSFYDDSDSLICQKTTSTTTSFNNNRVSNLFLLFPRKYKTVNVKVTADGYEEYSTRCNINIGSRESFYTIPSIHLKKKNTIKEVNLDGVTVTASKVKMVMHGDTIVYNADAFKLSNGSMLDELIRRLPGAQLKGNQIMVNGRFVSSLLVNGTDFFKGNPAVALQNLPAYTVNKLKVYEKKDEMVALMGDKSQKGELPLVMDVNLKRQYMQGVLANADLGYGTHDRWMTRLFALRYTKASRIGMFANLNNVNDTRSPGTNGEWNPTQQSDGLTTQRSFGLDYQIANSDKTFLLNGNTTVEHNSVSKEQIQSSERFLEGGNTFGRLRNNERNSMTLVKSSNTIEQRGDKASFYIYPEFVYYNNRTSGLAQSANFSVAPNDSYRGAALDSLFASPASKRLQDALMNRLGNSQLNRWHFYDGKVSGMAFFNIPRTPDRIEIQTDNHINSSKHRNSSIYDLAYNDGTRDFRNKHNDQWATDFKTEWEARFWFSGNVNQKYSFFAGLKYTHEYKKDNSDLFRLDKYAEYGAGSNVSVGYLPSTRDSLQRAIDADNTYHSRIYKNRYDLTGQTLRLKFLGMYAYVEPGLNFRHDRIEYTRGAFSKTVTRSQWAWEPRLYIGTDDCRLTYKVTKVQPELTDILDYTTSDDPLNIWSGNPNLKNTDIHRVEFNQNIRKYDEDWYCKQNINIKAYWQVMRNAIGQSVTYNRQTGVVHTTPKNINGNWNAGASFEFTGTVDKKKRLMLSTKTEAGYMNSVDYTSVEEMSGMSPRSSVRSAIANETMTIDYSLGKYAFGAKFRVAYLHAESPRADFQTINTADVDYGLNATVELPLRLRLSTDLTLYSRYSYSDASMNTNNLVWNARLERSFGKFILMADGFDLLGKLSNVRKVIDAQGRTETWYNTVPRYAMLHVMYKLHFKPKAK